MLSKVQARWLATLLFFIFLTLNLSHPQTANAIQVGNLPVDVTPIFSPQQTNPGLGYFQVDLKSGEQTTFGLKLQNHSGQRQSMVIRPLIATTSAQGAAVFSPVNYPDDSSLTLKFTKLISPTKRLELEPKETRIVNFNFKVPANTSFKGTVLGSLYIYSPSNNAQNKKAQKTKKGHFQFVNNFAIYLGVQADINQVDKVLPQFRIRQVQPQLSGATPVAMIQLQNYKPAFITDGDLLLAAKIYHRGSNKVLIKTELPAANFAPNSTMYLPIPWPKSQLSAGQYTLKMYLTYGYKSWHLTRNFTVTGRQVNTIQKELSPKQNYGWLWIIIIVLVVILSLVVMLLVYRQGKRKAVQDMEISKSKIHKSN